MGMGRKKFNMDPKKVSGDWKLEGLIFGSWGAVYGKVMETFFKIRRETSSHVQSSVLCKGGHYGITIEICEAGHLKIVGKENSEG